MTPAERLAPIDVLKAVAILTVIGIHAVAGPMNALGRHLLELARFAVPLFFAVSGWLYCSHGRPSAAKTLGRLRRVLVPYLVASLLAQVGWWLRGSPRSPGELVRDLLTGASFGPYYYVFVITLMILATPLLARARPRGLLAGWGLLVAFRAGVHLLALLRPELRQDMFWVARDPTYWGVYFLAGWVVAAYREPLAALLRGRRPALGALGTALTLVLAVASVRQDVPVAAHFAGWLNTVVVCAVAALVAAGVARVPVPVRFLSEATYTLYLFHLFFVLEVQHRLMPSLATEPVAWAAGVLGPCLVVTLGRGLLGARSRTWLGA